MNTTKYYNHRLLISSGEPAGIGPEQVIKLAQQSWPYEWVAMGSAELFKQTAQQLKLPLELIEFDRRQTPKPNLPHQLKVIDIPLRAPVKAGILQEANAHYVLDMLHLAVQRCLDNTFDAFVTGPIHKGIINQAGIPFTGHTELLAEKSNTDQVVMMLATPGLRVPLVTTHLPLSAVPGAITPTLLESVLRILHQSLKSQFKITSPKIFIMGLNPHAGEDGHLGTEEITTIIPVINHLIEEGMDLMGPLPADTIFSPDNRKQADAFLAMYHDQGLPVLKTLGFGHAVNITLGLPFIRTSVDHGTALNIAGQGKADIQSFEYALTVANEMIVERKLHGKSSA
ncbi:MAG: 4-hydroxythreonine-4-phosphate dehydrogenase PdxA [Piscirickettsiaceae bacterium CG_4_9_14_3_um_filter_43_564]|nr:4-hydroxythreonine-4-phosphate dehydrogenase PdxA [Thiomicrospira sp.]OIP94022.1 MAG: 4-hydroxythreonine-4-phosphate dehydrogenase PdxA [Thiomicrospira sp. CG2_30_44_34]PIQ05466.1 MAG: 4-hydroxythreonine-4-phosphate dehydrogenase PdxA [Piscirickettsiaceae bacterium CG18_big_fil_WC_8_21_14_2_50_44_103]PIU39267.1 MAG: 4-hydroxythreonine-4-phosphate dehydrogenase PdxA [Piscirickettsiaceae bacterium CG07_land_8_20_14_0_80_44_28]PIW77032.1 MAG: 4-hydroxythreonine-4-phosphate dehydrogenase PdxA [P